MSTPTHASLVVNNLEYVEETDGAYGVMPTNPTMLFLAQTAKWSPSMDVGADEFRRLGSEDVFKILQKKQLFKSSLEFAIANSMFIKYGINAIGGGAGSIDKSLSLGMSVKLAGTTNYITLLGTRISSIKLSGNPDKAALSVTAELQHSSITTPTTGDYKGTGAHASADTNPPWTYYDGGVNPITWGSALPVEDINVTIERTLSQKWVMGSQTAKYQLPVKRGIKGDLTQEWLSTTQEAALKLNTRQNLTWVLKTGVSTLTITNASLTALTDRTIDADADETIVEKYTIDGEAIAVT